MKKTLAPAGEGVPLGPAGPQPVKTRAATAAAMIGFIGISISSFVRLA
jgi:hypothetical protein